LRRRLGLGVPREGRGRRGETRREDRDAEQHQRPGRGSQESDSSPDVHASLVWRILRGVQAEASLPTATIRRELDDFVVEELPAYPASGEGDHLFLTIVKRGVTSLDAV